MTTLREAAQQALGALEALDAPPSGVVDHYELDRRKQALRVALAQQEQEPVAWQWLNSAYFRRKPPANAESGAWNPLFTHPPRREWQSLTDDEINAVAAELGYAQLTPREVARAIEQALKEKNA